jgi:hypothetical protein
MGKRNYTQTSREKRTTKQYKHETARTEPKESTGRQAAENEPRSTYNHETAGTELKEKV